MDPMIPGRNNKRHKPFIMLTKEEVLAILNSDLMSELIPY
jgi:hypothetical protein